MALGMGLGLRSFYASYFMAVGVSLPFLPPYLRGLGLSGRQVATMLSIAPFLHLGVPLVWGWVADRTRRPDLALRLACFGAFLCVLPLITARSVPALLLVFAAHGLFSVPIISLVDSLALERVRHGDDYARIRLLGSLSCALTCMVVGQVLSARGGRAADPLVPTLVAAAYALTIIASLAVRGHGVERERPHAREMLVLLRDPRFRLLLVMAPVHWACSSPFHGFFAILLQDRGLSAAIVGRAFLVSVSAELAVLFFFRRLHRRFGLATLLAAAFAASLVRWVLVTVVHDPHLLVALQLLHGLTYGVFWGAALAWLGACVSPHVRATGQAMFTAASFGLGNIVGMYASGALYDAFGRAEPAFLLAAAVELVPFTLALTKGRRLQP